MKGFFIKCDQIRGKPADLVTYWRNPEWKTSFFVEWYILAYHELQCQGKVKIFKIFINMNLKHIWTWCKGLIKIFSCSYGKPVSHFVSYMIYPAFEKKCFKPFFKVEYVFLLKYSWNASWIQTFWNIYSVL